MFKTSPPVDFGQYINVEEGLARIRGNKTVYKAMLTAFLKDTTTASLQQALEDGDLVAAERGAHSLKGMAGNLSFPALFRVSTDLDALLKEEKRSEDLENELSIAAVKTNEYVVWLQGNLD